MRYLSEIIVAWGPPPPAAACMGTGSSMVGTVTSAIAPTLIADAGWSKAQFAMTGILGLLTAMAMPLIGRLADVLGVKITALIGLVAMPLAFLGYSFCGGSFTVYLAVFVFQSIVCVTTTATVYTRLVIQHIRHARGLALAIVACGPALSSALGGPLINEFVEARGWVATYQVLAIFVTLTGIATFLLMPTGGTHALAATSPRRRARDDYPEIFRNPAFWILFGSMYLCNLPLTLILVQLKMLVLDNGITGEGASIMFTALAGGMLMGRFVTGLALDRLPAQVVSFVTLGLPALGLYVLATDLDTPTIVTLSIFCLGFSVGAVALKMAFLVARYFRTDIYSSVLGLLTAVTSFAAASGAAYLSWTLSRTGHFNQFLVTTATTVIIGSLLLLLLGRVGRRVPDAEPSPHG